MGIDEIFGKSMIKYARLQEIDILLPFGAEMLALLHSDGFI